MGIQQEVGKAPIFLENAVLSLKFLQAGQNVLPQKVEAGHFDLSRQDIKLRQDIRTLEAGLSCLGDIVLPRSDKTDV